jgi:hypothetical protein
MPGSGPRAGRWGPRTPAQPQVPIIEHPDVKRMLLFQRAVVEGSLSLICNAPSTWTVKNARGRRRKRNGHALLLELLTPVAKSYPAEMGILSVSAGLQMPGRLRLLRRIPGGAVLPGHAHPPIHEGTTGIQGLDLLGRKVPMDHGAALKAFQREVIREVEDAAEDQELAPYGIRLARALEEMGQATMARLEVAGRGEVERYLADATLYLEAFGLVAVAWQWLKQGIAARRALGGGAGEADRAFYQGKLATMRFFFHYELPKLQGLTARLMEDDGLTTELTPEDFSD